jgi:hypothetical protein
MTTESTEFHGERPKSETRRTGEEGEAGRRPYTGPGPRGPDPECVYLSGSPVVITVTRARGVRPSGPVQVN